MRKSKKFLYILVILSFIFLNACSNNNGSELSNKAIISGEIKIENEKQHVMSLSSELSKIEGDFLVKLEKNISDNKSKNYLSEISKKYNIDYKIISKNIILIKSKSNNENLIIELKNSSYVAYIEENKKIKSQSLANDPYFDQQWNLQMLNMPEIWEKTNFNNDIKIAVLDTGIITNHKDLSENVINGYDFVDDDNEPKDESQPFSHGSHVAATIAALRNNQMGIAGMVDNVKIMPVRIIGENGGLASNLIKGINWAIDNNAQIINLSLASSGDSNLIHEAIVKAVEEGITVIAASGNDGKEGISYPAAYPEVISVGAINSQKEKAYFSNYGQKLDLVAPGVNILSIYSKDEYNYAQGTSMATPHVSAVVALLYQKGINSPQKIKNILKTTATKLNNENYFGAGLINPNEALSLETSDFENISDENTNTDIDYSKIKIFNLKSSEDNSNINSFIKANENGEFTFESTKGQRKIVAWLDLNNDGKKNSGDLYGEREILVEENINNLEIKVHKLE